MHGTFQFLQQYKDQLSVAVSFAILIATCVLIKVGIAQAKASEMQAQSAFFSLYEKARPRLVCSVDPPGGTVRRGLYLRNVGRGPAYQIQVKTDLHPAWRVLEIVIAPKGLFCCNYDLLDNAQELTFRYWSVQGLWFQTQFFEWAHPNANRFNEEQAIRAQKIMAHRVYEDPVIRFGAWLRRLELRVEDLAQIADLDNDGLEKVEQRLEDDPFQILGSNRPKP